MTCWDVAGSSVSRSSCIGMSPGSAASTGRSDESLHDASVAQPCLKEVEQRAATVEFRPSRKKVQLIQYVCRYTGCSVFGLEAYFALLLRNSPMHILQKLHIFSITEEQDQVSLSELANPCYRGDFQFILIGHRFGSLRLVSFKLHLKRLIWIKTT